MTISHPDDSFTRPPEGFTRTDADVNGTRLSYLLGGDGPTLVLLHGWPQTSSSWRRILPALAAAGYRVLAPDLRGTGRSGRPDAGYAKDNQAEDIRQLVRAAGLGRHVRLVGHDIGGMVAFAYARRHPEEVLRLALVELALPGFGLDEAMDVAHGGLWHFGLFMTPEFPELLFAGHERDFFSQWYDGLVANHHAFSSADLDAMAAAYTGTDALRAGFGHYRTLLHDRDVNTAWHDAGGRLLMPVLAVGGAHGVGTQLADSVRPAAPDVIPAVVDGSGHFIPEEQPGPFVQTLLPFLA